MRILNMIIALLKEQKKSQKDLTDFLGISNNVFTDWKSGRNKSYQKHLPQIAEFFGVSVDSLLGKAEDTTANTSQKKRGVRIPVLGRVAAGIPIEAIEDIDEEDPDSWEEIPESMARTGDYFGLRIHGESMTPKMIEGDIVIVRKQESINNGEIAIVAVNGDEATCKRVMLHPDGSLALVSLNPSYDPMYYSKKEVIGLPVSILGKVVELRRKI